MSFDAIGDGQTVTATAAGAAGVAFANPTTTRSGVLIYNKSAGEILVRLRRVGAAAPTAPQVLELPSYRIPSGSTLPIGVRGMTVVYLAAAIAGDAVVQEIG